MRRTRQLPRVLLGAALALIILACAASAAQAEGVADEWTWTNYGPALRDVSCDSPQHCVAVGQQGMVMRSTATADSPLAWSRVPLEYPVELDGVSCTKTFCLAVSNSRQATASYESMVYRSADGGATWSAGVVLPADGKAGTQSALAIACDPSGATCYAAGPGGGIWRSGDEGRSWKGLAISADDASYEHIACPAAGTCVASGTLEEEKKVVVGKKIGSVAVVEGESVTAVEVPRKLIKALPALACDSPTRCVVTDALGHYGVLSIPGKEWEPIETFPKLLEVTALSCPRQGTCVGLSGALAVRTTNLGADDTVWKRRPIGSLNLGAISCTGDGCVAVGKVASWWTGTESGFDWNRINEVAKFEAIQCPAGFGETCAAGGEKDIGVSNSEGKFWAEPLSGYSGLDVKSVNCTGKTECLFLNKTMTLFTKDLIAFKSRHPTITDPKGTDAQTCVTKDICVGINEGVVYTTLDGAVTDWTQNSFPEKATSVACVPRKTDPIECVATTREFVILGKMTRDDGKIRWSWRYADVDPSKTPEAVGCSTGGWCTVAGPEGMVLASEGANLMEWTEHIIKETPKTPEAERPAFKSVACPGDGVCLVGGVHGPDAIISSTKNNWNDWTYEKIEGIEGASPTVSAFGCETVNGCVGVGGGSLVGTRKAPVAP
ncbi:MAG TPA: sialidase family protein [Solirubrobacterales bacterium]|nr:sialidase family protein [Solirubrobacterales bacterium]